jgi:uncharacterized protein
MHGPSTPFLVTRALPTVRRPTFTYTDTFDPRWTPRFPELACVANAVSMAMPHAEPLVVKSVRDSMTALPVALQSRAEAYARQEAAHHAQHHRFNQLLMGHYPGARRLDRVLGALYGWISRRNRGTRTGFAAGFEVLAFCVASWVATRADLLFRDAEPEASRLFLWHLGEEVEHRGIAHDVHYGSGGTRRAYFAGLVLAFTVLAIGTFGGAISMLATDRRLWKPVSWGRLISWGIGFLWLAGPLCVLSFVRHPDEFAVPSAVAGWADDQTLGSL